jgi:probable phosphoglycerate mutase
MPTPITRVFLVRHGATVLSAEDRFAGATDVEHWERLTRREVEERFPEEAAEWERDPYTFAPQGGESGLAVTARALPVLIELVRTHPAQKILVVSHKATIRLLLSSLLGFDPRRYRDNLDLKPASLSIVDFKGPTRSRLALFNDTSHYAQLGNAIPPIPETSLSKLWNNPAAAS